MVTRVVLLSVVLLLAARDVAVIDVGGGARIVEVRAAITRLDPSASIIAQTDAQDLYETLGRACTNDDATCWQKVALAGAVQAIVLVPAGDSLVFVDAGVVVTARGALSEVVERGLFPQRFGIVRVAGAPVGAVVTVDGGPLPDDGVLRAGNHAVHIEAPGHAPRDHRVVLGGAATLSLDGRLTAEAAPPSPAAPPSALWTWSATAAAVAAVAGGTAFVCEAVAGSAIADADAGRKIDVASLRIVETVEVTAFIIAGVAAATALTGAAFALSEEP